MDESNAFIKKKEIGNFLILFSFAGFLALQNICVPFSKSVNYSDSSIYQYIGHLVTLGKMPYVDAFDHKGSILYLINALGCLISPKNGIWIIDTIFMMIFFAFAYLISRKFVDSSTALVTSLVVMLGVQENYWIGNTPDFYAAVMSMCAVFFLVDFFIVGDLKNKQILLVGVFSAIVFWLKPNCIGIIGGICIAIIVKSILSKKLGLFFRCLIFFFCGLGLVTIPILIWLFFNNAIMMMFKDYFLFNFVYAGENASLLEKINALYFFLRNQSTVFTLINIFIYYLIYVKKNSLKEKCKNNFLLISSCITLIFQILICAMPGREYTQYGIMLFPVYVLIISIVINEVQKNNIFGKNLWLVGLIVLIMIVIPNCKDSIENQEINWNKTDDVDVVEVIKNNTQQGDKIAVASPDHGGLYLWSGCESATNTPYIQASLYDNEDFWRTYIEQLKDKEVRVIVWNKNWPIENYMNEVIDGYIDVFETEKVCVYLKK